MFGLGGAELAVIGVVALLFLGPKKIPELAKGLGKSLTSFKKGMNEELEEGEKEKIEKKES